MNKFNQLTNNLFALDNVNFEQLEKTMRDILRRHGFVETAHVTFADGGFPTGSTSRKAYYSPQLEVAAVIELSQDWDDYYNDETDSIEWRDYYHLRIYLYNHNKPFSNDDLYFLGDFQDFQFFSYNRNNFNDLYVE